MLPYAVILEMLRMYERGAVFRSGSKPWVRVIGSSMFNRIMRS